MNAAHPRDADPSITGQPHQATDRVLRPDGQRMCTHGHAADVPAAVRISTTYRRNSCPGPTTGAGNPGTGRTARVIQAAPRCNASQTAVDSRTPSSTARPQCAIQAATPSGVPETYPSNAAA